MIVCDKHYGQAARIWKKTLDASSTAKVLESCYWFCLQRQTDSSRSGDQ